ncbi:MAG TPA: hypothetical protein VGE72_30540 [Azospirillum sp.]
MRWFYRRAASAFILGAAFSIVAALPFIAWHATHLFTSGLVEYPFAKSFESLTGLSISEFGAIGAIIGAMTGGKVLTTTFAVGHSLLAAAKWCTKKASR